MEKRLNDLVERLSDGQLDRREFLTRMAVIPGGVAAAAAVLPMLPAETAQAQFGPPPFTPAEGQRRHARIRAMMAETGLDCMIIPHRAGYGVNLLLYASYVSGGGFFMFGDGAVVFPLEGDPIAVANRFPSPWISRAKPVVFEDGVQVPLTEVAHELMDYGAGHLRAGKRFGDLMEEMESISTRSGFWHRVPHIHSMLPMILVGPVFPGENAAGSRTLGADVEVQEGMLFSFEPSAHGGPMASAKVGATAVVTTDGLDVFNTIGTRVQQV